MKKGKKSLAITIGITFFILVMIMFMQFKMVFQTDITSIETMREEELQEQLASWKKKYEETEAQSQEITETLNKYKEESSSDSQTKENLEEELNNLNLMLGTTDVQGKGIIITLKETENTEEPIKADELMVIVNYLKDAGAEAISINGQRIINSTYFSYINNSYVRINGQRLTSPFEIKVIGEPDYLKSSLIGNGGYVEKITSWGQEINFEEKKKIEIPKYNDEISTKYMKEK